MFNVTRLAIKGTKITRNLVKNVATEKINLGKASENLKDCYEGAKKYSGDYSKNIFKRIFAWAKGFVVIFKNIKNAIKEAIAETKDMLGKDFNKATKKDVVKSKMDDLKEMFNDVKEEVSALLAKNKSKKASGAKK